MTSNPHLSQAITVIQHHNEFHLCKVAFSLIGATSFLRQPARDLNLLEQPLDVIAREARLSERCSVYHETIYYARLSSRVHTHIGPPCLGLPLKERGAGKLTEK